MRCQYLSAIFRHLELCKCKTQKVIEKTTIIPYHLKPNVDIKRDNGSEIYFNGSN